MGCRNGPMEPVTRDSGKKEKPPGQASSSTPTEITIRAPFYTTNPTVKELSSVVMDPNTWETGTKIYPAGKESTNGLLDVVMRETL